MKAFRLSGRAPMASGRPRLLYDRPRISLESMPFAALSHGYQQQDTTDRRWVGRLSGLSKASQRLLKGLFRPPDPGLPPCPYSFLTSSTTIWAAVSA